MVRHPSTQALQSAVLRQYSSKCSANVNSVVAYMEYGVDVKCNAGLHYSADVVGAATERCSVLLDSKCRLH